VPRAGEKVRPEKQGQPDILVASPPDGVGTFSSTTLRAALERRDEATVTAMVLSPAAAALLLRPSAEEYASYASDYTQLKVEVDSSDQLTAECEWC
jgi:hypothetical protein